MSLYTLHHTPMHHAPMQPRQHTLPASLQQIRRTQRISQLELSLRLGVSQRHISFIENGRAKPSRALLAAWLQELQAPLFSCNEIMLQAGFAPLYSEAPLDDPALAQANRALEHLLSAHDPMPAIILDTHWNLLRMNNGAKWLAGTLMPWTRELIGSAPINMIDLLSHPEGMLKQIINLEEAGVALLAHLRHEALSQPTLTARIDALASLLGQRLGVQFLNPGLHRSPAPTLNIRYASPFGEIALFSMFTTFGTPQDITLASLRVEHMFAANRETQAIFARHVGTQQQETPS
ncbi:MAG: helix-turn-helix domain-containing protein [Pseudomonadales bacterium]|nr:helix-turn-helix domain-containing protein [Pseudomonadales bacterium]